MKKQNACGRNVHSLRFGLGIGQDELGKRVGLRRDAIAKFGATRGDFGWVLSSNGPMVSVGEAVGGKVNKVYRIYQKAL